MIQPQLHQAFAHTRYRVRSPAGCFVLQINRRSAALARWPRFQAPPGSVLVTAWNPAARVRSLAANRAAERRLRQRLRIWQLSGWPTRAQDPKGRWPDEPGVLIAGVPLELAAALGRALGQRAVLYIASDHVPRLLWL